MKASRLVDFRPVQVAELHAAWGIQSFAHQFRGSAGCSLLPFHGQMRDGVSAHAFCRSSSCRRRLARSDRGDNALSNLATSMRVGDVRASPTDNSRFRLRAPGVIVLGSSSESPSSAGISCSLAKFRDMPPSSCLAKPPPSARLQSLDSFGFGSFSVEL